MRATIVASTPSFRVKSTPLQPRQPPPNSNTATPSSVSSIKVTSPPCEANPGLISVYSKYLIRSSTGLSLVTLGIKAPNAKMPKVTSDSPVEERIKYLLYTEINPGLASHGGDVTFIELTEEGVARSEER